MQDSPSRPPGPTAWVRRALPAALVGIVAAFWLFRVALPPKAYSFASIDPHLLFLPTYELAARWFASGSVPWWNPFALGGLPWIATLQGGFFYPPHVLYLLLPGPTALATSAVLHLALAAVGMLLFARRMRLGAAAALFAAVLFALRGQVVNLVYCPAQLEAVAWLPLGALAVTDVVRRGGRRPIAFLGLAAAASLLAGYPQATLYVFYAWAAWLVFLLPGVGVRRAAGALAGFAAALGLGALAAGCQLVPAFHLASVGNRPTAALGLDAMFPMAGIALNAAVHVLRQDVVMGSRFSCGVVGLALVPAALLVSRRRALALWALVVGTLAVLFSLGPLTPLFPVYLLLPGLAWFRAPSRVLVLADFAFALLAATGLDAVARRGRAAGGLALAGLVVVGAMLATGILPARNAPAALGVAAAGVVVLVARLRSREGGPAYAAALVAAACAEIALAPPPDARLPYAPSTDALYQRHAPAFARIAAFAGPARVWIFDREGVPELAPKAAIAAGVRAMDDYEQANLRRQADYFSYFMAGSTALPRDPWVFAGLVNVDPIPGRAPPATRRRLLDLAAVRYVLLERRSLDRPEVRAFVDGAALRRGPVLPREPWTPSGEEVLAFENPNVLPRAYLVYRTEPAPSPDELLRRASDPAFDPLAASFVEGDAGVVAAPDAPARGTAVAIVRDEPRLVELAPNAVAPALVVLADAYDDGWEATVDDRPVPVVAANHLFRGVAVPPGAHRVRFAYRPPRIALGALATGLGVVTLGALLLPFRRAPVPDADRSLYSAAVRDGTESC